jgi:hypothetical protein
VKAFLHEFNQAAKQGPRMYFAPLVGAIKAIRVEITRQAGRPEPARNEAERPTTAPR